MYQPSKKILENYADVIVNFAVGGGKGLKSGETVVIHANEYTKPLYVEVAKAVWKKGGHVLHRYLPSVDEDYNLDKAFFELAQDHQLDYFPAKYMKGLVEQADHLVFLLAETNPHALRDVHPEKIMRRGIANKPYMEWRNAKEHKGKFTWTIALYGTPAMAREAALSLDAYWQQIIDACFLSYKKPLKAWQDTENKIKEYQKKLTSLHIDKVHLEGKDVDLWIKIGEKRKWLGGGGRNIPSFEIFTSPDWRGTNGWIRFNQPLYHYGNIVSDIKLEFKDGLIVKSSAKKGEQVLKHMIATEGGNKVGEFSLTDKRFSKITKFMANTLFDENMGGTFGNTHIALGAAYKDCVIGDPTKIKKATWKKLGFNDSSVHTDIISTTDRTVTAYLKDGTEKIIYKNGQFTL